MRYGLAWPTFAKWWNEMEIKPARQAEFDHIAQYICTHKAQYLEVQQATVAKVPWFMIGCIHWREAEPPGSFNTYLGNGQPLNRRTTIVPKGRGPFPNFLAGALDAIKYEGWNDIVDWRLEKILYYCGLFNGLYNLQTPYLWGGTNIQKRGKYVADHIYNPFVWDQQPGCAPILKTIQKFDPSILFVRET